MQSACNELFVASEFTSRWTKFRDALRHEDQLVWDEMFKAPETQRDAISAMGGASGFEATFMAMMVEQEKVNNQIDAKLAEIEERVRAIERK